MKTIWTRRVVRVEPTNRAEQGTFWRLSRYPWKMTQHCSTCTCSAPEAPNEPERRSSPAKEEAEAMMTDILLALGDREDMVLLITPRTLRGFYRWDINQTGWAFKDTVEHGHRHTWLLPFEGIGEEPRLKHPLEIVGVVDLDVPWRLVARASV